MKDRPDGFISEQNIDHDSEIFDYIRELHQYLWEFVRAVNPGAQGLLSSHVDKALAITRSAQLPLEPPSDTTHPRKKYVDVGKSIRPKDARYSQLSTDVS